MDVVIVRWPEESSRREAAARSGCPRLLLVASHDPPPAVTDPLEDWVRADAPEADVAARVRTLRGRALAVDARPELADGVLRHAGVAVALGPIESALVAVLLERFGAVVPRDVLARAAWPAQVPPRNVLDVHVLRLRRRLAPLRLAITTVRARGYMLEAARQIPDRERS